MTKANYQKLSWAMIAAWFLASLTLSALHVFSNASGRIGLSVAIAAVAPILLFLFSFNSSAGFRDFVVSVNPRILTAVQTWRIGGFVFLVLFALGVLPGVFAIPAGAGDVLIGATATFVAWNLADGAHRRGFIRWQALGILDLVTAVSLGTTARFISPNAAGIQVMTVLPLSMVPTFFVPLLLIFHVICIAQARRWPERGYSHVGGAVRSPAA